MADYNLGTARGTIEIGLDDKGITQAKSAMDDLGKKGGDVGAAWDKTAKGMATAGAVITAGLGIAVNTAADFEQSLSKVQAATGASGEQMDLLREKALQLGKDTAFSAGESANAMVELGKAGISTTEILSGAADATVALAAAGELDMASAAAIMTAAMNNFNIAAEDSTRVADLLAGTANSTATDVTNLGMALRNVGPIANALGVSLEDTTTALGILAQNGLSGSRAGTSLMATLRQLNPATKKASDVMEDLGLITEDGSNKFFDAQGNMKSLSDVSQLLQDATKDLTAEQKQLALTTIFGSEGFAGAAAMAQAGAEGFDELAESIGGVSAADVAATKMDNLRGSIEEMTGGLETLAINIGAVLLPYIRTAVDAIANFIDRLLEVPPGVVAIVAVLGAFVGIGLLTAAAFIKLTQGIMSAVSVLRVILPLLKSFTLAFVTNPIFLTVAAIAALAAGLYLLYQRSETARNVIQAVWQGIRSATSTVVSWFTGTALPALTSFWNIIQTAASQFVTWITGTAWPAIQAFFAQFAGQANTIRESAAGLWTAIQTAAGLFVSWLTGTAWPAMQAVWSALSSAMTALQPVFTFVWNAILQVVQFVAGILISTIQGIISGVMNVVNGLITVFTGLINFITAIFTGQWGAAWEAIKQIFSGALQAIWGIIQLVWYGSVLKAFSLGFTAIRTLFTTGFNAMRGIVSGAMNFIRNIIISIWNAIRGAVSSVLSGIRSLVQTIFNAQRSIINRAMNTIRSVIVSIWNAIRGSVTSVVNGIRSVITSVFNAIRSVITSVLNGIRSVSSSVWNGIRSTVTSVVNNIKSVVTSGFNGARTAATNAFNGLKNAATSAINTLLSRVRSIVGSIKGVFSGAGGWLTGAGRAIIQGLIDGVSNMIGSLRNKFSSITRMIPDWKGPKERDAELLTENGQLIMESLMSGLGDGWDDTKKMLQSFTHQFPSFMAADINTGNLQLAGAASHASTFPRYDPTARRADPGPAPLVGGDLVLQAKEGQPVQGQLNDAMFKLRTIRGY